MWLKYSRTGRKQQTINQSLEPGFQYFDLISSTLVKMYWVRWVRKSCKTFPKQTFANVNCILISITERFKGAFTYMYRWQADKCVEMHLAAPLFQDWNKTSGSKFPDYSEIGIISRRYKAQCLIWKLCTYASFFFLFKSVRSFIHWLSISSIRNVVKVVICLPNIYNVVSFHDSINQRTAWSNENRVLLINCYYSSCSRIHILLIY